MTNVQGPKKHRKVMEQPEFDETLKHAKNLKSHPYYALRDQAILCILWLTGKRALEVAQLEITDLKLGEGLLRITFTVLKKRNHSDRDLLRTKAIPTSDPYSKPITKYYRGFLLSFVSGFLLFLSTILSEVAPESVQNYCHQH